MDTNYANLVQLNEVKATSAAEWSPREALISMLRRIDANEISPTAIVIIYAHQPDGGEERVNFTQSVPGTYQAVGMLEVGKAHIMEASRVE